MHGTDYPPLDMTKIGLVADIHANLAALERSLEFLRAQDVDAIVCAGDLVEKGAQGDAVVALLQVQAIPCVMGNHDFDAIGNQDWLRANADLNHPAMQGKLLKADSLAYLRALPSQLEFTWDERRVVLTHGAPWSNNEYIFANSSARLFERIVAETGGADVVILGHTHQPMHLPFQGTRIINPGAVCGNHGSSTGSFGIMTLPDFRLDIFSVEDGALLRGYV
jgi:putative phosphoesterase